MNKVTQKTQYTPFSSPNDTPPHSPKPSKFYVPDKQESSFSQDQTKYPV